jgi:hypothetical protein
MRYTVLFSVLFLLVLFFVVLICYCSSIKIDTAVITPAILGYRSNVVSSIDPAIVSPVFMSNW